MIRRRITCKNVGKEIDKAEKKRDNFEFNVFNKCKSDKCRKKADKNATKQRKFLLRLDKISSRC